ncbi:hypothetical protein [Gilliamella sp. Choc5-1]|nr:hypothetical protein [Gilliamella apicola]
MLKKPTPATPEKIEQISLDALVPQNGMATHFQTKKLRGKCFLNSTGGK